MKLLHSICKTELTIACKEGDCAIYVWCNKCNDLVEEGETVDDNNNEVAWPQFNNYIIMRKE